ncbi:hypothetical protein BDV96DRAFT_664768 [Lophiotrema nucula]|uniref:Uncharacterized protein n=1 Tax=Lophiotrema nucula TaxID=690887 RepID=A0A6A5Z0K2_9PLEO|nr:hypothetical protein BDV96DRAFT_664768 [Lophiotrema nucula]
MYLQALMAKPRKERKQKPHKGKHSRHSSDPTVESSDNNGKGTSKVSSKAKKDTKDQKKHSRKVSFSTAKSSDKDDAGTAIGSPGSLANMNNDGSWFDISPTSTALSSPQLPQLPQLFAAPTLEADLRDAIYGSLDSQPCTIADSDLTSEQTPGSASGVDPPAASPPSRAPSEGSDKKTSPVDGDWDDTNLETAIPSSPPVTIRQQGRNRKAPAVYGTSILTQDPAAFKAALDDIASAKRHLTPEQPQRLARQPSFRKRNVGRLLNPNPLFDPSMQIPPNLNPHMRKYWQWLEAHGCLAADGTILPPQPSPRYVDVAPAEAGEFKGHAVVQKDTFVPSQVTRGFVVPVEEEEEKGVESPHHVSILQCNPDQSRYPYGLDGTCDDLDEIASSLDGTGDSREPLHESPASSPSPAAPASGRRCRPRSATQVSFTLGDGSRVRPGESDPFLDDISEQSSPFSNPRFQLQSPPLTNTCRPIIRQQEPQSYQRPWGHMADLIKKLQCEEDIETWKSGILVPARPPTSEHDQDQDESVSTPTTLTPTKKTPSRISLSTLLTSPPKPRKKANSDPTIASSVRTPTSPCQPSPSFRQVEIDTIPIYLTQQKDIPVYPPLGTTARYEFMLHHPTFDFSSSGYISHSLLTRRIISLFNDPSTAPDWAEKIPDIPLQYRGDEQWTLYRETLVIRADIRRGCGLAVGAAKLMVGEWRAGRVDGFGG